MFSAQALADNRPELTRDPFKPTLQGISVMAQQANHNRSISSFELRGIIWDGQQSLVNISGQFLAIGEQYDGYELTQITEHAITFQRGMERLEIPIAKE
jgi:hypothetical protein